MTRHRAPEDVIAALRTLGDIAKQDASLTNIKNSSSRLVKLFTNSSKTLQNRKFLQDLRKEISNLGLVLNTAVTTKRVNTDAALHEIHVAQECLLDLAEEMEGEELTTNQAQALPTIINYDPTKDPDENCGYTKVLFELKAATSTLERMVNPDRYKVNGKLTFRATGAVMNADGDIGSANTGAALHDYSAGFVTVGGNIGSGNDTSGTDGNVNLARGAHIRATKDFLSDNKGNLGTFDLTGTRMKGGRLFAGNRVDIQKDEPSANSRIVDDAVQPLLQEDNPAVQVQVEEAVYEETVVKSETVPPPSRSPWWWFFN